MGKTLVWGLKIILCVGLILVGIGPWGLAQSTDDSTGEETQLANNKIVRILHEQYELTDEEIKDYRVSHNLGYGEILILYALADRILGQTEGGGEGEEGEGDGEGGETGINTVVDDILAKRTEMGLGWGEIAQEYELKLGQVVSSVRKKEKGGNDDAGQTSGGYKLGKDNAGTQQAGGDHKQGKKDKGKDNKGHHGKSKGEGKGKGKK